jgi:hypothetical protein
LNLDFSPNYRGIVAAYEEGREKTVSESILKRYEIAQEISAKKLKMSDFERSLMQPFVVSKY